MFWIGVLVGAVVAAALIALLFWLWFTGKIHTK